MLEPYCKDCKGVSIRKQVWAKLDENPELTPKMLAKELGLPYKQYANYITKERHMWKYYRENERGSKCSESHHCRYRGKLLNGEVDRVRALGVGWVLSKSRNRFIFFKSRVGDGRVVWYETGKLRLFVKKPASLAKAKRLFCEAFFQTLLISDIRVLNEAVNRLAIKGAHSVYPVKEKNLPGITITTFQDTLGFTLKIGDKSHPDAVEVIWEVTEHQEKLEDKFEGLTKMLSETFGKLTKPEDGFVKGDFKVRGLYE